MSATPEVSVIIPAFRAETTIAHPIASLFAQSVTQWEAVIVADDAQDYRAVLESRGMTDPRLRFAATGGMATGVSHARNTGLSEARAPIIALLDADDAFYPEKLARMLPLARMHGCCVCPLRYREYTPDGVRDIHIRGLADADRLLTPAAYMQLHYSSNAMLVFDRTRLPIRWREDLEVMEDLVFSLTAFNHLPHIYHVNEILHEYVYRGRSLSSGPDAPARFLAAKRRILEQLEQKTLGLAGSEAAEALSRFTRISLEAEQDYAHALSRGANVTFIELLAARLGSSGSSETGL